jgi:RimJ/RimL family protein N-acetyltransferase
MHIATTERVRIRWLTRDDAPFILRLLNDEGWLRFIGDKNVHSIADAIQYLENGSLAMYARHGHGLYAVEVKDTGEQMGLCGLLLREGWEEVDIGFAFLPEFRMQGYAEEAARATLDYGRKALGLPRIVAITDAANERSKRLLSRLGMRDEGMRLVPGLALPLAYFAVDYPSEEDDKDCIDGLTASFFRLFAANEAGNVSLERIRRLFVAKGVIVKACGEAYELYDLAQFIAPREKLLNDGTLVGFREWEESARTEVFGCIAQRISFYRKSGRLNGTAFETRGVKTFQFVKTPRGWRISALAWDDERPGLKLPENVS